MDWSHKALLQQVDKQKLQAGQYESKMTGEEFSYNMGLQEQTVAGDSRSVLDTYSKFIPPPPPADLIVGFQSSEVPMKESELFSRRGDLKHEAVSRDVFGGYDSTAAGEVQEQSLGTWTADSSQLQKRGLENTWADTKDYSKPRNMDDHTVNSSAVSQDARYMSQQMDNQGQVNLENTWENTKAPASTATSSGTVKDEQKARVDRMFKRRADAFKAIQEKDDKKEKEKRMNKIMQNVKWRREAMKQVEKEEMEEQMNLLKRKMEETAQMINPISGQSLPKKSREEEVLMEAKIAQARMLHGSAATMKLPYLSGFPQTQIPLTQVQVPLSQAHMSIPGIQMSIPHVQMSVPQNPVLVPQGQLPLSLASVAIPQAQMLVPQSQLAVHGQMTVPQAQMSLMQPQASAVEDDTALVTKIWEPDSQILKHLDTVKDWPEDMPLRNTILFPHSVSKDVEKAHFLTPNVQKRLQQHSVSKSNLWKDLLKLHKLVKQIAKVNLHTLQEFASRNDVEDPNSELGIAQTYLQNAGYQVIPVDTLKQNVQYIWDTHYLLNWFSHDIAEVRRKQYLHLTEDDFSKGILSSQNMSHEWLFGSDAGKKLKEGPVENSADSAAPEEKTDSLDNGDSDSSSDHKDNHSDATDGLVKNSAISDSSRDSHHDVPCEPSDGCREVDEPKDRSNDVTDSPNDRDSPASGRPRNSYSDGSVQQRDSDKDGPDRSRDSQRGSPEKSRDFQKVEPDRRNSSKKGPERSRDRDGSNKLRDTSRDGTGKVRDRSRDSSWDGPDRPRDSSWDGPDRLRDKSRDSSWDGPDRPRDRSRDNSSDGPDRPRDSSWDGPDRPRDRPRDGRDIPRTNNRDSLDRTREKSRDGPYRMRDLPRDGPDRMRDLPRVGPDRMREKPRNDPTRMREKPRDDPTRIREKPRGDPTRIRESTRDSPDRLRDSYRIEPDRSRYGYRVGSYGKYTCKNGSHEPRNSHRGKSRYSSREGPRDTYRAGSDGIRDGSNLSYHAASDRRRNDSSVGYPSDNLFYHQPSNSDQQGDLQYAGKRRESHRDGESKESPLEYPAEGRGGQSYYLDKHRNSVPDYVQYADKRKESHRGDEPKENRQEYPAEVRGGQSYYLDKHRDSVPSYVQYADKRRESHRGDESKESSQEYPAEVRGAQSYYLDEHRDGVHGYTPYAEKRRDSQHKYPSEAREDQSCNLDQQRNSGRDYLQYAEKKRESHHDNEPKGSDNEYSAETRDAHSYYVDEQRDSVNDYPSEMKERHLGSNYPSEVTKKQSYYHDEQCDNMYDYPSEEGEPAWGYSRGQNYSL